MKHNHSLFIDIAQRVAKESTATRLKVGAVIAKDGSLIDYGYNGTPTGWYTNDCEVLEEKYYDNPDHADILIERGWLLHTEKPCTVYKMVTKPEVIHAEMNALLKCVRLGKPVQDAFLYITHAPCDGCAKHIVAAGIKEVFYIESYRSNLGLEILKKANIKVIQWEKS